MQAFHFAPDCVSWCEYTVVFYVHQDCRIFAGPISLTI
jgi:hypothetical protein